MPAVGTRAVVVKSSVHAVVVVATLGRIRNTFNSAPDLTATAYTSF